MTPLLVGLLGACGSSGPEPEGPVAIRVWATDVTASGGILVVQTSWEDGLQPDLPEPEVEGLVFTAEGGTPERIGGRTVLTRRWRFTGKKGSYQIPPLGIAAPGGEPVESLPIWVDVGVQVSDFEPMADIEDPSRIWTIPWGWVCGLGTVVLLGLGGLGAGGVVLLRPRPRPIVVLPADIRCLRAWEAVRADDALPDEDKARELSRLFREYTEEVLAFPAVSWTTTEIVDKLQGMVHLPQGNVPRAKKLLNATDLIKYAEVAPGTDFFEEMDADLRAFVASTRPAAWSADGPARPEVPGG